MDQRAREEVKEMSQTFCQYFVFTRCLFYLLHFAASSLRETVDLLNQTPGSKFVIEIVKLISYEIGGGWFLKKNQPIQ